MEDNKRVDFSTYCPKCVNIDKGSLEQPCKSCLRMFTADSGIPVWFIEEESKNMIKRFGKVLNHKEEVKEKLDLLFDGFNQLRSLFNDHHKSIEEIRHSVKDLSRNIESHKGRLDGIDDRLEEIIDRIGDYERERYEKMVEETKEKIDECEQELKDSHTVDSFAELRIHDLKRELELIKNNQEVYNLGYQTGYRQGIDDAY